MPAWVCLCMQAYLTTRTRVLQIADNDDWQPPSAAFGGGLPFDGNDNASGGADGPEKLPMLVLNPDHREILIASQEGHAAQVRRLGRPALPC